MECCRSSSIGLRFGSCRRLGWHACSVYVCISRQCSSCGLPAPASGARGYLCIGHRRVPHALHAGEPCMLCKAVVPTIHVCSQYHGRAMCQLISRQASDRPALLCSICMTGYTSAGIVMRLASSRGISCACAIHSCCTCHRQLWIKLAANSPASALSAAAEAYAPELAVQHQLPPCRLRCFHACLASQLCHTYCACIRRARLGCTSLVEALQTASWHAAGLACEAVQLTALCMEASKHIVSGTCMRKHCSQVSCRSEHSLISPLVS